MNYFKFTLFLAFDCLEGALIGKKKCSLLPGTFHCKKRISYQLSRHIHFRRDEVNMKLGMLKS